MNNPLIKRYKRIYKEYTKLYDQTPFISVTPYNGIHIKSRNALEFAPQEDWIILHRPNEAEYPYEIRTTIDGLTLFAILSQDERNEMFVP